MMGREFSKHRRDYNCIQSLSRENLKGRDLLEDLGVDERIINIMENIKDICFIRDNTLTAAGS
jgi:hypothetical protein